MRPLLEGAGGLLFVDRLAIVEEVLRPLEELRRVREGAEVGVGREQRRLRTGDRTRTAGVQDGSGPVPVVGYGPEDWGRQVLRGP